MQRFSLPLLSITLLMVATCPVSSAATTAIFTWQASCQRWPTQSPSTCNGLIDLSQRARFALLGGEPLLNPAILEHIQLARQHGTTVN